MLHRYWLKLVKSTEPSILNLGCGITAYNEEDAKKIFAEIIFPVYGRRNIIEIIQDIDVSKLDHNHIRANMGITSKRGVWFPLL